MLYRTLDVEVRGIDEDKRTAEFVATTEAPVPTHRGPEVLRMAGLSLRRFRKNSVVLDTHNHSGIQNILGSATVKKDADNRRLLATVRYATNARGEEAWQLVKGGHLKAVSIGYTVDPSGIRELAEGETDGEGGGLVTGPAIVAKRSELFELSMVPIPADEDALRRAFYDAHHKEEAPMAAAPPPPPEAPLPKDEPETRSLDDSLIEEIEARKVAAKALEESVVAEAAARAEKARADSILAFAPSYLREFAEDVILSTVTAAEARELIRAEHRRRSQPVGTPEPEVPTPPTEPEATAPDFFSALGVTHG